MKKMFFRYSFSCILFILGINEPVSAQSLISVSQPDGFIIRIYSDNPKASAKFKIYNIGQNALDINIQNVSADSTFIVYADEPDTNTFAGNICSIRPNGSSFTQLTLDTLDFEPAWSPDGGKILFYSFRSGNLDIWTMNPDGTNLVNLTNSPANEFHPSWSHDGKTILFASDEDSSSIEIYKMDTNGQNRQRLTFNNYKDVRPKFSPSGDYFATQSKISGEYDIMIYDSAGNSYANIGAAGVVDYQPSWTPFGNRVVWVSGDTGLGHLDIVSAKMDGSDFRVEYSSPGNDYIPSYSPDGQLLAFSKSVFNFMGGDEIFVWNKALDTLIQITNNSNTSRKWAPNWSPFTSVPKWISISPDSIYRLTPNDSVEVSIKIDMTGYSFGNYSASVMISDTVNNELLFAAPINIVYDNTVAVYDGDIVPYEISLSQNYPNPFNPTTTIKYTIPTSTVVPNPRRGEESSKISPFGRNDNTKVILKVYDLLGREVAELVNKELSAGNYEVEFNARASADVLPSGIYFYTLSAGKFNRTKKMMLIK